MIFYEVEYHCLIFCRFSRPSYYKKYAPKGKGRGRRGTVGSLHFFSIYFIMAFPKKLKDLCTPALVYFVISIIALVIMLFQNLGNNRKYSVGSFSFRVPSTILIFVLKLVYILFWTWILNLICKDGHVGISWFLVLFPYILFFVLIGLIMINN